MLNAVANAGAGIEAVIAADAARPPPPEVTAMVAALHERFGDTLSAVLFYGSCLRTGRAGDGVIDLYALVDSYRGAYRNPLWAVLNAILPPNVYHFSAVVEGLPVRAKVAVLSLAAFRRGASRRAFQPSVWGRFCQPTAIVHARDEAVRRVVTGALCDAVGTMLGETVALMGTAFTARELWVRAFTESYATELRAERAGRAGELYDASPGRYETLAWLVVGGAAGEGGGGPRRLTIKVNPAERRRAALRWQGRRWLGKALSLPRLVKAAFTFAGGADYILWKIERHSGVRIAVTPWQMRHPVLAAPVLLWRLYRRGAFR